MNRFNMRILALTSIFILLAASYSRQLSETPSSNTTTGSDAVVFAVPKEFFIIESFIEPTMDEIYALCKAKNVEVTQNDLNTFEFPVSSSFREWEKARGYLTYTSQFRDFWKDSYILTVMPADLDAWRKSIQAELRVDSAAKSLRNEKAS